MNLPLTQSQDQSLNQVQQNWKTILDPVIANPITQGLMLSNVKLKNGVTIVNHLLSRKLQGWFIVGINGASTIFDNQASNQSPQLTLSLTSSAAVTVSLWVF